MSVYFYAPAFHIAAIEAQAETPALDTETGEPILHPETGDPVTNQAVLAQLPVVAVGQGDPVVIADPMPPGGYYYDSELDRFVLKVPDGTSIRSGWALKTLSEVSADYPGRF